MVKGMKARAAQTTGDVIQQVQTELDQAREAKTKTESLSDVDWIALYAEQHGLSNAEAQVALEVVSEARAEDRGHRDEQIHKLQKCVEHLRKALNCVKANNHHDANMHLSFAAKLHREVEIAYNQRGRKE